MTVTQKRNKEEAIKQLLKMFPGRFEAGIEQEWIDSEPEASWSLAWTVVVDEVSKRVIKQNPSEAAAVMAYVESLLVDGTEDTQMAVCNWFLEPLLHRADDDAEGMVALLALLGSKSKAFCHEYNKYHGVTNLGLER